MNNSFTAIAKFNYDNKKFQITMVNNKNIIFSYYDEENKLHLNLSNEYYNIINAVYNSLLINKETSVYIKTTQINNTLYDIFYDTKSCNYFWTSNKEINNTDDNVILNSRYNDIPLVYYNDDKLKRDKKSDYYNKILNLNRTMLLVSVAANLSLLALTNCSVHGNTPKNEIESSSYIQEDNNYESTKREYNYEEIRQAIESNKDLSDDEKELIYNMKFLFDENNEYMDLDLIIERLKTLKFEYCDELKDKFENDLKGCYSLKDNLIKIKAINFEKAETDTLVHEILHVFQSPGFNDYTIEFSNEVCTNEVIQRLNNDGLLGKHYIQYKTYSSSGYTTNIYLYYILADMLPADVIREYQFSCNKNLLANELVKLDNEPTQESKERAYQLIESFNDIKKAREKHDYNKLEQARNNCEEKLNYYYNKQNGMNIDENANFILIAKFYSRIILDGDSVVPLFNYLCEMNPELMNEIDITLAEAAVTPKTYFSENNKYLSIDTSNFKYIDGENKLVEKHFEITDDIVERCKVFLINEHKERDSDEIER